MLEAIAVNVDGVTSSGHKHVVRGVETFAEYHRCSLIFNRDGDCERMAKKTKTLLLE